VRQALVYVAVTGGLALLAGGLLVAERGGMTLQLLAAGAFFVLFYTWPLKYIGLGEISVLLVWGPLMIGGAYFVIAGRWDWNVALVSLIYACGATSVLFGKHIDKLEEDRSKRIHTLPVLLGERGSRHATLALMVLPYLLTATFVIMRYFTPAPLLVLLALKRLRQAFDVFRRPRPDSPPAAYPKEAWPLWFVSFAFVHNRAFGSFFLLGLFADVVLRATLPA
jgi:1,4-dihydroxy-2-naphthoate octaprenyltransferase